MKKLFFTLFLAAHSLLLTGPANAKESAAVADKTSEVLVESHNVPSLIAKRIQEALTTALPGTKLPAPLVLAIMKIESGFNPLAKGGGGAAGLMQVMPNVHLGMVRDISEKPNLTVHGARNELMDVDVNVEAGVTILAACYERHSGNVGKTAECYNGYGTSGYRAKVMRAYQEFSSALGFQPR